MQAVGVCRCVKLCDGTYFNKILFMGLEEINVFPVSNDTLSYYRRESCVLLRGRVSLWEGVIPKGSLDLCKYENLGRGLI